jgi:hypothetical protein
VPSNRAKAGKGGSLALVDLRQHGAAGELADGGAGSSAQAVLSKAEAPAPSTAMCRPRRASKSMASMVWNTRPTASGSCMDSEGKSGQRAPLPSRPSARMILRVRTVSTPWALQAGGQHTVGIADFQQAHAVFHLYPAVSRTHSR